MQDKKENQLIFELYEKGRIGSYSRVWVIYNEPLEEVSYDGTDSKTPISPVPDILKQISTAVNNNKSRLGINVKDQKLDEEGIGFVDLGINEYIKGSSRTDEKGLHDLVCRFLDEYVISGISSKVGSKPPRIEDTTPDPEDSEKYLRFYTFENMYYFEGSLEIQVST